MTETDQGPVLALLADPATWGGAGAPRRVDTHISAVFLAGDRVLKMKKAVRLPFLDFTTLAARHAACRAEVEINRRAAPSLYLGALPVTRAADGRLAVDGEGEPVEWLVHMRRFDETTLFSRLATAGPLDRKLLHALAEAIVRFHAEAPVRRDRGGVAGLAWTIDTNAASMAGTPSVLPPDEAGRLAAECHAWLERLAPLLEERRRDGRVRQCHGDLHLGNLCLVDGRPTLFDAIEFSEDIACIDVVYDLAFLLMDLQCRGQQAAASMVLNHYLDLTGDYGAVAALPLFLSLRAGVRAHVSATMAAQAPGAERDRLAGEARAYLAAARAFLAPPPPRLLAVGGLSGSGKSRMGRELAPFLAVPGAVVVRTDALRKQMLGVGLLDRLGPEGYTPEVTGRTYAALYETCARLLASGHAVVADAVFARPDQREAIAAEAAAAGVPFHGLWLETDPEVARERVAARTANASDATVAVLDQQLGYDLGPMTWSRIDTSGSREAALEAGRAALGL